MTQETPSERERFEALCAALPEGVVWGDHLTVEIADAIWQAAKADAAGKQETRFDAVLRITTAYEQGFGQAMRSELNNPYAPDTQEHESWDRGREAGALKQAAAHQENDRLKTLLDEVRQCFTRDDDLPNDLLSRIDTALLETAGNVPLYAEPPMLNGRTRAETEASASVAGLMSDRDAVTAMAQKAPAVSYADVQPTGEPSLPEQDRTKPSTEQGLFRKFEVRRTDGSDAPGGKHCGCEYFVLDVTHDQHATAALMAYATAAQATHPLLVADMRDRYGLDQQASSCQPNIDDVMRLVDAMLTRRSLAQTALDAFIAGKCDEERMHKQQDAAAEARVALVAGIRAYATPIAAELDRLREENKALREVLGRRGKSVMPEFVALRTLNADLAGALQRYVDQDRAADEHNCSALCTSNLHRIAVAALAKWEASNAGKNDSGVV